MALHPATHRWTAIAGLWARRFTTGQQRVARSIVARTLPQIPPGTGGSPVAARCTGAGAPVLARSSRVRSRDWWLLVTFGLVVIAVSGLVLTAALPLRR